MSSTWPWRATGAAYAWLLAPGVYVEETSFRAKSIEGVGTSTTAFVGPTRKGPVASTRRGADGDPPTPPELITSFGDFVRVYGGLQDLAIGGSARTNHVAHAVSISSTRVACASMSRA